ncbi:extensin-like domain-containing protein [Defluviimonas sp. SAOS-178_SWC]|uniref:extensin-like domain-containing protein n=1 Tax=Defluviimonas sp. SAOS-178_SWC TaxID=3121287 RepID=UPI0032213FED
MRAQAISALALWATLVSAASAAPMAESLRPTARPHAQAADVVEAALVVTRRGLRPKARPEIAPEVARAFHEPLLFAPSAFAPLASLRPEDRPSARPAQVEKVVFRTQPVPEATIGKKGAICGDPAIVGKPIPPIAAQLKGCGLENGVSVISVAGVALTQPASIDCPTAKALKTWVETGVKPVIGRKGGGLAALQVAASYSCRGRNNQKGAKVSEHGRGRAVDISALLLADGTAVTVLKGWGSKSYGTPLASVRKAACGPFNTVLGPGSDRFHADHFHLDTARGRGAYCR